MESPNNVTLMIDGQVFKANKETLCEHSDYFRAMFSGNYLEQEQQEIVIDVVDSRSMQLILRYMEIGLIDLSEYSLSEIRDLALAANFLQITELMKQIEYCLDLQLTLANWAETMAIAEGSTYMKLEQLCVAFGLFNFYQNKPEYIPNIHRLCSYLSHPYLAATNELDVFKFGLQWITSTETGADALIIILGCLDFRRLHSDELREITLLIRDYVNSLAAKVVDCILYLNDKEIELSTSEISHHKLEICEKFTERVYSEVINLMKSHVKRQYYLSPLVPVWMVKDTKLAVVAHSVYTFNEKTGFEKYLEVADKNLWGWNIVAWGMNKLVVVCGEHGRGTGIFMKDVRVYDTLRKEWTWHGVQLPNRRHGGVAIVGDTLFLVGGVGGYRVVLDQSLSYDLKQRTYRKIAKLPDVIQRPAMCVHNNMVYANGQNEIFRYEDFGEKDRWLKLVDTEIRPSSMTSYKNYIYCTHSFFSHLYRFRPDIDTKLELVTDFSNPPATVCNLGNRLLAFTRSVCGPSETMAVEEYVGNSPDEKAKTVWTQEESNIQINEITGSCALVMTMPPVRTEMSEYIKDYLKRYHQ